MDEAKDSLARFPGFPYDGRRSDAVIADIMVRCGPQSLIENARPALATQGIDIPDKF